MEPLSDDVRDAVRKARELLTDEEHVRWAENEAGDLNEGYIVYLSRALVALADRLGLTDDAEPSE